MFLYRLVYLIALLICSLSACLGSSLEFTEALPAPREIVSLATLDDPQPDTLLWDNGNSAYLWPGANYWIRVEFVAPDTFSLRSIYFYTTNYPNAAGPCSVWVHADDDGEIGDVLSVYPQMELVDSDWNDGNLPAPVTFNPGDIFYVVLGPVPGGDQNNAWVPMIDGASTGHGALGTTGHYGVYDPQVPGDWMVRCGGIISSYTDLRTTECWNIVNNVAPSFNILPNDEVLLHGTIENIGSEDVINYTVNWTINGPGGNVYNQQTTGTNLNSGQELDVTAPSAATLTAPGEYMASCQVTTAGDGVASNNTTLLRFFVGDAPRWFYYDDNEANTHINPAENTGHGISFTPPNYPARIESLRVEFGGEGLAPVAIYLNNGENGSPGLTAVWSDTPTVVEGWNTIALDSSIDIFEGQSFTVATQYHSDLVSTGKDDTPPNAAGISHMTGIGWFWDGAAWGEDTGGNWCIQAFMDTSSAVPPYPVLEVSVTQLSYGNVAAGTSESQTFWVYNRGAVDDLDITAYTFQPVALSNIYIFNPSLYSVAAGDSQEVTVTFSPAEIRAYTGRVFIVNNSENTPSYQLLLLGTGIANDADDPESGMPREFALSQNYPNPFNPSTQIEFALPVQSAVKLSVFNTLGQQVATLLQGNLDAGFHSVEFGASDLSAGLYFYKLEAGAFTQTRKMMLLK
jgi:hypothetical protein